MNKHIEGAWKCRKCGIGFDTTQDSVKHRMQIHGDMDDKKLKLYKDIKPRNYQIGAFYDY